MVLQAKLERRQRHQAEKSCIANEESRMLGSIGNTTTGHPQSIPPPSEPVLPAGNKVLSPQSVRGPTLTQMEREAVPEHSDIHTQSPTYFTEEKTEARHSTAIHKGELAQQLLFLAYCVLLSTNLTGAFYRRSSYASAEQ